MRKVFPETSDKSFADPAWEGSESTLGEKLLEPSLIYAPTILNILNENEIHAIAHITGGGLPENVARILGETKRGPLTFVLICPKLSSYTLVLK